MLANSALFWIWQNPWTRKQNHKENTWTNKLLHSCQCIDFLFPTSSKTLGGSLKTWPRLQWRGISEASMIFKGWSWVNTKKPKKYQSNLSKHPGGCFRPCLAFDPASICFLPQTSFVGGLGVLDRFGYLWIMFFTFQEFSRSVCILVVAVSGVLLVVYNMRCWTQRTKKNTFASDSTVGSLCSSPMMGP